MHAQTLSPQMNNVHYVDGIEVFDSPLNGNVSPDGQVKVWVIYKIIDSLVIIGVPCGVVVTQLDHIWETQDGGSSHNVSPVFYQD